MGQLHDPGERIRPILIFTTNYIHYQL